MDLPKKKYEREERSENLPYVDIPYDTVGVCSRFLFIFAPDISGAMSMCADIIRTDGTPPNRGFWQT